MTLTTFCWDLMLIGLIGGVLAIAWLAFTLWVLGYFKK